MPGRLLPLFRTIPWFSGGGFAPYNNVPLVGRVSNEILKTSPFGRKNQGVGVCLIQHIAIAAPVTRLHLR